MGSIPGQRTKIPHSSEQLSPSVGTVAFTGHNERSCVTQWWSGSRQKINELKKNRTTCAVQGLKTTEWNTAWSGVLSFYSVAENGRAKPRYSFVWPYPLKLGFPGGSGKKSACNAEKPGSIPGREDPEKQMATHSSILAWRVQRQRSLAGYSPWGCKEPDTNWVTNTPFL